MVSVSAAAYPQILYSDCDAGIEWLVDVLGFTAGEVHRDGDGMVAHAELHLGGATVMLATAGVGREPFSSLPPGTSLVYLATDEIDGLYDHCQATGADIALELTDTDYGSRDFTVRDSEGNLWAFGTYQPGQ